MPIVETKPAVRPNLKPFKVKLLDPRAILPKPQSQEAVGLDLHALLFSDLGRPNKLMLPPRTTRNVGTGIAVEPPSGFCFWVLSRSGLASRSIAVMNAPGLIDPDYRGEIKVLLFNGGIDTQYIENGDRIAQLVMMPAIYPMGNLVESLTPTERGDRGLGSTGR